MLTMDKSRSSIAEGNKNDKNKSTNVTAKQQIMFV